MPRGAKRGDDDGSDVAERRERGALEAEVMAYLWDVGAAVTPAAVREGVAPDLAYTTVMTILTRLYHKGLVDRHAQGRAFAYRAAVSAADFAAQRMHDSLARTADHEAALARFVGTLSRADSQALRRALKELGGS